MANRYPVPLDWRVELGIGAAPDGDPSLWQWEDVGAYRRQSANITVNTGRADESEDVDAADSDLTVDLRDGALSPRSPTSKYYGKIGTNTPIRYRLPKIVVDSFSRTTSNTLGTTDTGQTWTPNTTYSTNGSSGKCSLTGSNVSASIHLGAPGRAVAADIDLTYSISIDTTTVGGTWVSGILARYVDANNYNRLQIEFRPDGTVSAKINRVALGSGSDLIESLTTGCTYTPGTKVWVRVQCIGPYLRVKVWNGAPADEPAAWSVSIANGNVRGGGLGLIQWRAGASNAGAITATIDDLQVDSFLWSGNVPEFPPRWDKSGNDSTAPLAAAGPLRRLNQANLGVQSPLARQLPQYGPTGYWPFEDAAGSTSGASALPGGNPAVVTGDVSFAGDSDSLPGASTMAKLGSTTGMRVAATGKGSTGVGFAGLAFFKLDALPAGDNTLIEWHETGTVRTWQVIGNGTGMWLKGFAADGSTLVSTVTTVWVEGSPTKTFSVQLETAQSGGNVSYSLLLNVVGSSSFWVMANGVVTGTAGRGVSWSFLGGVGTYNMSFGHIWLGPNTLPYVDFGFLAVSSGFAGEDATDRLARLFTEQGLALSLVAGAGEPMGPQKPGAFLDLVKEIAATDRGVLYEDASTLGYLPRVARYNRPPVLTLDWAAGGLAEAPEPIDDDQRLRNVWTVTRVGGSAATAQDDDSIDRHGAIPGQLDVNNASDERLPNIAEWMTAVGSVDELRWPSIKIDLIAHPEYIPYVLTMRQGDVVQLINPKDEQVGNPDIYLIVEGINHEAGRYAWTVELICSPGKPWVSIGVYDDATTRRDSASTTLKADRDSTQVSWTITTANAAELWTTAAGDLPIDLEVGGEKVTATAIGAASLVSGSYDQTITVTRSVNGIVKAQTAGTPISLWRPVYRGL